MIFNRDYSDFGFWPLNHSAFRRVLDIRHLVTELSAFLLPRKYLLLHFVFLSKVEFYKALVLSFVFHFSLAPNGCKKKKKALPHPQVNAFIFLIFFILENVEQYAI